MPGLRFEGYVIVSGDGMLADVRAVLAGYDFGRTEVVLSQDHFADPINNPHGRYLSTNQAFWDGIRARYDYVINLPIEFFAGKSAFFGSR